MFLDQYFWYHHVLGGALIGFASVFLMLSIGKIAGISGILGGVMDGLISANSGWLWRLVFIVGLMAPGLIILLVYGNLPANITSNIVAKPLLLIIAGLLVGFGASYGNGCTSGHGICGIGRLSKRSILATVTFMLFAVVTVFISKQLGG